MIDSSLSAQSLAIPFAFIFLRLLYDLQFSITHPCMIPGATKGVTHILHGVNVGASLLQALHHLQVTLARCQVQRRPAILRIRKL
jgi:hypothetical protein